MTQWYYSDYERNRHGPVTTPSQDPTRLRPQRGLAVSRLCIPSARGLDLG